MLNVILRDGTRMPLEEYASKSRPSSMINEDKSKKKSMINDRGKVQKTRRARRGKTVESTEKLADRLVKEYQAPECRRFFLKAAWHLPERRIFAAMQASRADRIASPLRYFVKACSNEMQRG